MKTHSLNCCAAVVMVCVLVGCEGSPNVNSIDDTTVGRCTNVSAAGETTISIDDQGSITQTVDTTNSAILDPAFSEEAQLRGFDIIESCLGFSDRQALSSDCQVELLPKPEKIYDRTYLPVNAKYSQECLAGDHYFMLYLHDQWGWYYSKYQVDLIPGRSEVPVGDVEVLPQWVPGARQLIKLVAVPRAFSEDLPNRVKSLNPEMRTVASFDLVKR